MKNKTTALVVSILLLSNPTLSDTKNSDSDTVKKKDKNQVDNENSDLKSQSDYKLGYEILNKLRGAKLLQPTKLPKGISSVSVLTFIPDCLKDKLSQQVFRDIIEFELRKIGIKIQDQSNCILVFEIDAFEADNQLRYVFTERISLRTQSHFSLDGENYYFASTPIWSKMQYGEVGKNKSDQSKFNSDLSEMMVSLCNRILESREK